MFGFISQISIQMAHFFEEASDPAMDSHFQKGGSFDWEEDCWESIWNSFFSERKREFMKTSQKGRHNETRRTIYHVRLWATIQ